AADKGTGTPRTGALIAPRLRSAEEHRMLFRPDQDARCHVRSAPARLRVRKPPRETHDTPAASAAAPPYDRRQGRLLRDQECGGDIPRTPGPHLGPRIPGPERPAPAA